MFDLLLSVWKVTSSCLCVCLYVCVVGVCVCVCMCDGDGCVCVFVCVVGVHACGCACICVCMRSCEFIDLWRTVDCLFRTSEGLLFLLFSSHFYPLHYVTLGAVTFGSNIPYILFWYPNF